jgi:hypothetical protein
MQIANFINGEFVPPRSGAYFDDLNPATAEVIAAIPDSDKRDVDDAVRAAKAAFRSWSRTSAADRGNLLLKLAELIEKDTDALARIESIDNGKTISLAKRLDIPRAVANFRFFATAILHQSSDAHVMDAAALNYTLRQPLGVVGLISPWNLRRQAERADAAHREPAGRAVARSRHSAGRHQHRARLRQQSRPRADLPRGRGRDLLHRRDGDRRRRRRECRAAFQETVAGVGR